MSDELLRLAQAGDRDALERLLAAHRQGVYRYGLRVCATTEDAEDAVQETLWAATRSLRAFRGAAASLASWLFTIVRRECLRLGARWGRALAEEPTAPERLDDGGLAAAIARLAPLHREAILLRDVRGLTAPEAALLLGVSVGALKSRLHRAREELRLAVR